MTIYIKGDKMRLLYKTMTAICFIGSVCASSLPSYEGSYQGNFSTFTCEKKDAGYLLSAKSYDESFPISLKSFLPETDDAKNFVEGLAVAFLSSAVISSYATYEQLLQDRIKDCKTEEEILEVQKKFALEKAIANANLHYGTAETCLPRFGVFYKSEVIGFARLGNGVPSDEVRSVFAKMIEDQNLGNFDSRGIAEPAVVLQEDFQNLGIGSLIVKIFFDSIIPAYLPGGFLSNVQFSGGSLITIYFTQFPENILSVALKRKIPEGYTVLNAGEMNGKNQNLLLLNASKSAQQ